MESKPKYLSIQDDIQIDEADKNNFTNLQLNKEVKGKKKRGTLSFCVFVAFTVISVLLGIHIGRTIKYEIQTLANQISKNQDDIADLQKKPCNCNRPTEKKVLQQWRNKRFKRSSQLGHPFNAAHLVGLPDRNTRLSEYRVAQNPLNQNFFHWSYERTNSFSLMEVEETDSGTFIVINRGGYYVVYSHVTYHGHGLYRIGHTTECIRSATEQTISLMQSVTTQQLSSSRNGITNRKRTIDAGYQSGMFYLIAGDKIGVKPINYGRNHLFLTDTAESFFGLYFVHS